MLRTRILTALVLLGILAAAAATSVAALLALGAAFLGVALAESLVLAAIPPRAARTVAALCALAAWGAERAGLLPAGDVLLACCTGACLAWVGIGVLLVRAQRGALRLPRAGVVAAAVLLGAVAWFALADLLRQAPLTTLSVLALVWVADMAAYFTGRALGRRKLASRISPGKTWEGVWGAVAAVVLGCIALAAAWPDERVWSTRLLHAAPVAAVAVLVVLVALSVVGDLVESLVKRQAGAKDSGTLLPGHGGVWDRIDATLPVLPLAVLAQSLLEKGGRGG